MKTMQMDYAQRVPVNSKIVMFGVNCTVLTNTPIPGGKVRLRFAMDNREDKTVCKLDLPSDFGIPYYPE